MAETRENFKGCPKRRRINHLRKGGELGNGKRDEREGDLASLALLLLRGSPRRRVRRAPRRGAPLLQGAVPAGADSPRRSSSRGKNRQRGKKKRKPPACERETRRRIAAATGEEVDVLGVHVGGGGRRGRWAAARSPCSGSAFDRSEEKTCAADSLDDLFRLVPKVPTRHASQWEHAAPGDVWAHETGSPAEPTCQWLWCGAGGFGVGSFFSLHLIWLMGEWCMD